MFTLSDPPKPLQKLRDRNGAKEGSRSAPGRTCTSIARLSSGNPAVGRRVRAAGGTRIRVIHPGMVAPRFSATAAGKFKVRRFKVQSRPKSGVRGPRGRASPQARLRTLDIGLRTSSELGQLDSNQHSELQRLAAYRLADVPANGAGGRIRTCKPRRAAALQAVELVVPDLLSADEWTRRELHPHSRYATPVSSCWTTGPEDARENWTLDEELRMRRFQTSDFRLQTSEPPRRGWKLRPRSSRSAAALVRRGWRRPAELNRVCFVFGEACDRHTRAAWMALMDDLRNRLIESPQFSL